MLYIKNGKIIAEVTKWVDLEIEGAIKIDYTLSIEEKEKVKNWYLLNIKDTTIEFIETEKVKTNYYFNALEKVNLEFEKKVKDFLADYPPSEILTFETKRVEAEKYIETGANIYIETLAAAKGWTATKLAETIQANSLAFLEAYSQLEAWKDGQIKVLKEKYNIT